MNRNRNKSIDNVNKLQSATNSCTSIEWVSIYLCTCDTSQQTQIKSIKFQTCVCSSFEANMIWLSENGIHHHSTNVSYWSVLGSWYCRSMISSIFSSETFLAFSSLRFLFHLFTNFQFPIKTIRILLNNQIFIEYKNELMNSLSVQFWFEFIGERC